MTNSEATPPLNSGARWLRWEPHIHTPGTVLNDQFRGPNAWHDYLSTLETATPIIRALGVTDYYSLGAYERVLQEKTNGRLQHCDLIFPNVEMRLKLGTVKGGWANIHLLISPEEPGHVDDAKRFLNQLTFETSDDTYACTEDDLVRLGKKADASITDRRAALKLGAEQFKVSFDQLREKYRASAWAKANVLIAVAGGKDDGTSGLRDSADALLRQEVEKFAHIIFASSPAQRDFWLGRKLDPSEMRTRYGGLKPCLHGSDAHDSGKVGLPDGNRYSWIKGAAIYDSLRQACIDPEGRAYVGETPPSSTIPSQVIASIAVENASWLTTPAIELNPGLVAIIGARGSGKTALADILAAGCDAQTDDTLKDSFLQRAQTLLNGCSVRMKWESGGDEVRSLDTNDFGWDDYAPRARYLSQKFVEKLCAADGMTDALMREVERVIYDAHNAADLDGAVDFDELLEFRVTRHRQGRVREERALSDLSDRIGEELEKQKLVAGLKTQVTEKTQSIERYKADRSRLVAKGSEDRVARLEAVMAAAEKVRGYLRHFKSQEQQLLSMKDEVADLRKNRAPAALRDIRSRYPQSGVKEADWPSFLLNFTGNVDSVLADNLQGSLSLAQSWKGAPPTPVGADGAFVAPETELERQPLAVLEAELGRLEKLVSIDRDTQLKFSNLSRKIEEESALLERLKARLADCEKAHERVHALAAERDASYVRVFESILAEQEVLTGLYAPIMTRLEISTGALRKLAFSVTRTADIDRWADAGEDLLDLRRQGPFKGKGTLLELTRAQLKIAWETGNADAVSAAMREFREQHTKAFLEHSPVPQSQQAEFRLWSKRFAQWLYGTDHIAVRYSVDYDGIDIRKLSPGTRGIVLLLLYLALDDADDRPLIIDQPEENLDPKSIYEELVALFLRAKGKRQVIMVTHNANLVVNTDADQIIVATVGPHLAGQLPPITYASGGLENASIRKSVCDILEGGEDAFRERARRLRVPLDR